MTSERFFHVRRFTLEAASPAVISSGGDDPLFDNLLARDANGLPMIPATTLAGAVRARLEEADARQVFGFQERESGQRSALTFTDALAHWEDDRPRDGWAVLPGSDAIVALLTRESPVTRQHVRLNANGVPDGEGKFERSAVPRGTRFTFEISCWGDDADLKRIAAMVRKGLSLGGAKRSGYGAFFCIAEGKQSFDLENGPEAERYRNYASAPLGASAGFVMGPPEQAESAPTGWIIEGRIEGPLLVGASRSDGRGGRQPYGEISIDWQSKPAMVKHAEAVLPGSAVKGPLRHRVLFHLTRCGVGSAQDIVEDVFGAAAAGPRGGAGKLRFHDGQISGGTVIPVAHVSLDRFTGGARDKSGALFTDDMIWSPRLEIRIDRLEDLSPEAENAFVLALEDLKAGLLGLGAEWGEGAGVFGFETCTIKVPEDGDAIP
ncbi:hypothetical protein JMM61_18825 [Rhodovulum sulfidophilum]|uniref:RAMP superfamily CRISPR-associated protein n=1 Tax=Rhodovulum sulfidophilum TaxID=35806 RepID=UPI0019279F85|nr:RAMP superfamily CRISPR-associated protein [Rhodovulum sulfidophilum]MBL3587406.1 hypothetical protein [Rhodovulum sulfidophilum]